MSDSVTQTRPPWLSGYPEGKPETIVAEYATCLEMFAAAVARSADAPAIRYFDGTLTYAEVDALTDAMAAVLEVGNQQAADVSVGAGYQQVHRETSVVRREGFRTRSAITWPSASEAVAIERSSIGR